MTIAKILFHKCLQNAQELGTNDEYMVSRVFFSIQLPGKQIDDLYTDIKQTVGDKFEGGTLEVGPPQNLKNVGLNYIAYRDLVEKYYRSLVGSTGSAFRVAENCSDIRMFNNEFVVPMTAEIEVDLSLIGAW